MDWLWALLEPYIRKQFAHRGTDEPDEEALHDAFVALVGRLTVTVLVQEPWRGSVRFKGLDRMAASEALDLLRDPESYLRTRFGGGKYKLNFHDGWNFVATQNFKPRGEPKWPELPELDWR